MYRIIYYRLPKGSVPSKSFLNGLGDKTGAKARKLLLLLSEKGPFLKRPYADYLRDKIYELRVNFGKARNRLLYFYYMTTTVVITHGFVKNQKRVPEEEIKYAIKCRKEFIKRYKNEKKTKK